MWVSSLQTSKCGFLQAAVEQGVGKKGAREKAAAHGKLRQTGLQS